MINKEFVISLENITREKLAKFLFILFLKLIKNLLLIKDIIKLKKLILLLNLMMIKIKNNTLNIHELIEEINE
jgi:hypothetical protein